MMTLLRWPQGTEGQCGREAGWHGHRGGGRWFGFLAVVCLLVMSARQAPAASGTWNVNAAGTWSTAANWASSIIADGADSAADFTFNITTPRTVTLDTSRSIGSITFTDPVSSHNYTLAASGGSTLTLDVASGVPTINVTQGGRTAFISIPLEGDDGLNKLGPGALTLSGPNTFSGGIFLDQGLLTVTSDGNLGDVANDIVVSNAQLTASGFSTDRNFTIVSGTTFTNSVAASLTINGTVSGPGVLRKIDATGFLALNGTNTYGITILAAGELRAEDGVGLSAGNLNILGGGIWSSPVDITRGMGTTNNQVQFTGDAGFSAYGGDTVEVNLSGLPNDSIDWGVGAFGTPTPFYLNNGSATTNIILRNNINLNAGARGIAVLGNVAEISGIISNSALALTKTGAGVLWLTGTNTFTGVLTVDGAGGTLRARNGVGLPTATNLTLSADGIWETDQDITRALGANPNEVRLIGTGSCGFSAYGAPISVNLGGAGATIPWGMTHFAGGVALVLNQTTADNIITFVNPINLNGTNRTITVLSTNYPAIVNGIISGSLNVSRLTKAGAGTLVLGATNTWTHPQVWGTNLILTAGTLQIDCEENLGGTPGGFQTNSLLLNGGTLKTMATFAIDDADRGIRLAVASAIEVLTNTTLSVPVPVGGAFLLTKRGGGALVLSNTGNTYGNTTISEGVLSVSHDNHLGAAASDITFGGDNAVLRASGTFTMNSGRAITITAGTTGTFDVTNGVELTVAGVIATGTGALTKIGQGTLILSGVNLYDGLTTIANGTIRAGVAQAFGSGMTGNILVEAGTMLDLGGFSITPSGLVLGEGTVDNTLAGTVTLGVGVGNGSGEFEGVIQNTVGTLGLTKNGTGTYVLSGTNTYSGNTTIAGGAGVLSVGSAAAIPHGMGKGNVALNIANGRLDLNGWNTIINGLTSTAAGIVTNSTGSVTLTLGDADATATAATGIIRDGAGSIALVKVGTGTQTLGGALDFDGGVTVSNGVLEIGGGVANLYAGTTTVDSGATLKLTLANSLPNGAGRGNLVVNGVFDNNGLAETINGLSGAGVVTNTSTTPIALIVGDNDQSGVFSGQIGDTLVADAISLTKIGSGTLTLTGSSTYYGMTSIQGGTIAIDAEDSLGSNPTVADADHIEFLGAGATLKTTATFDIDDANRDIEVNAPGGTFEVDPGTTLTISSANVISGAGGLAKTGTGTLVLNAANTHTGTFTNHAGLVRIGTATGLGTVAGGVTVLSGAAVDLNGQTVGAEPFVISGTGIGGAGVLINDFAGLASLSGNIGLSADSTIGGSGNLTLSGIISNAFALTKVGAGTHTLSGVNTYTGDTIVNAGTLQLGGANERIANASDLVVSGGTFGLQGFNETVGAVTLTSGAITGGAGTLTGSVYNVESGTISGRLGGSGGLTKTTAGAATISSTSTYTGETAINAGTLTVTGNLTLSPVTINAGGTLKGTGVIGNSVTNKSGGTYAVGTSVGAMTNGTLHLEAGSINEFEFNTGPDNDQIYVSTSGGLTIDAGALVYLYAENTVTAWTNNGTYFLIAYSGALNGNVTNLVVANPQGGKDYQFTTDGSWVKLDINSAGGLPEVDNAGGATNVTAHGATLQGSVVTTGGSSPDVFVYWGASDGDTNAAAWAHTNSLGTLGAGPFSVTPPNYLAASSVYYYRTFATNVNGQDWAEYTTNFTTAAESGSTEVAIDPDINDATDEFGPSPNTVFISDTVGYVFYTEPGGPVNYRKTTDGGASWGSPVNLGDDQDDGSVAVWYDGWTPDDGGTRIHIVHTGAGAAAGPGLDDLMYNSLDTSGDVAGSWRVVVTGNTWSASARAQAPPTITKTSDGRLLAAYGVVFTGTFATNPVCWSWDGTAWLTNSPTAAADDSDFGQLLPLSGGDVLYVQEDDSAAQFRSAVLSSNGSWSAWTTIAASVDDTTYLSHFGAAQNKLTGDVYLVGHTDPGTATGDLNAYKFSDSGRTWSTLAQVVDDAAQKVTTATVMVDENSGNLYAVYGEQDGAAIGVNPTNVYIKVRKSTDDGATWGSATAISSGFGRDIRNVRGTLTGNERLYAVWTDEDANILYGNTVADLSAFGLVAADVTVAEGNAGTTGLVFRVSMSAASPDVVTVNYATADGTAAAGVDYTATSGMLTFNPGTTSQTVTVSVNGDTDFEFDDTLTLNLSAATNTTILRTPATGIISNDDAFVGHFFVDKDATGDNSGFTWANAYTNLNEALYALGTGVEIWVAEGTYKPGATSADFFMVTNNVTLYGGFAGTETNLAQRANPFATPTILSGDIDGTPGANLGDALNVVKLQSTNAVVDGFQIVHGYHPDTSNPLGAGMIVRGARNTIRNCIFRENAAKFGGAVSVFNGVNSTQVDGTIFENCEFHNNRPSAEAAGDGEGTVLYVNGVTVFTNCTFYGNNNGTAGAYSIALRRGTSTFVNCILWDDEHNDGDGGSDRNFFGGGVGNKDSWSGAGVANFCDVKGGWDTGSGADNIAVDPQVVDAANSNLQLTASSPCIDAGSSSAPASDLLGLARPQRLGMDIGAYETDWTGKPIAANAGVGDFTDTSAIVNGSVVSTGGAATAVSVYWGTTDGGTVASAWQYTNAFSGTHPVGSLTTNLAVSDGPVAYYFRYFATNSYGGDWARPVSGSFIVAGTHAVGDNMDFEDITDDLEATPYWINFSGDTGAYATQGVDGVIAPQSGVRMERVVSTDGTVNDLYQSDIDLSPYTNAFANGAGFSLTPHFNKTAASGDDLIDNIVLIFRDASGTGVGTFSSGNVSVDDDPATWETATLSGIVPATAVSADLQLRWTDVDGSNYAGSYWDNIEFDITVLSGAGYVVTVAPNPLGLDLVVDGSAISSNTYLWEAGSIHTIAVANAVQELSDGVRYVWSDWSNGGAQTQAVTITMATNLTANFGGPEFRWRWSVNVPGAGTVTPASETWYATGSVFTAEATTLSGSYTFTNWSGDVSGTTSNISVTMDGKKTAVANFVFTGGSPMYVDDTAAGTGLGTSWADAFTNLQTALSAVPAGGVDIWVAAGTYKPGTATSASFSPPANTAIYGGFAGNETALSQRDPAANLTILSGDLSGNDSGSWGNRTDNSLRLMSVTAAGVRLDGLVLTGGYRPDTTGGVCLYINGASPTVANCVFTGNRTFSGSDGKGSAVFVTGGSPVITNCVFSDNYSRQYGGHVYTVSSSPTFEQCVFAGGHATDNGGAMFLDGNNGIASAPLLRNCLFAGNYANGGFAGALRVDGPSSGGPTPIVRINGCTFSGNRADQFDGAIFSRRLNVVAYTNNISWGNSAGSGIPEIGADMGAIVNAGYSVISGGFAGTAISNANPQFTTVASGTWASVGAYDPVTRTSILTANGTPGWTADAFRGMTVNGDTGQFLQFVIKANTANTLTIWGDASQVASAGESFVVHGYRLDTGSPAQNNGSAVGASTIDLAGTSRPQAGANDMGAYESIQHQLTLNVVGGGYTVPTNGVSWRNLGDVVPLTATANAGYEFSAWSGDVIGSVNPTNVTMSADRTVTATFVTTSSSTSTSSTTTSSTSSTTTSASSANQTVIKFL